jgi:hypothetical protein
VFLEQRRIEPTQKLVKPVFYLGVENAPCEQEKWQNGVMRENKSSLVGLTF